MGAQQNRRYGQRGRQSKGAGERPPEARNMGDYYALVKRASSVVADAWPVSLRDRLPEIGVPLRDANDVPLDLQVMLDRVWDEGGYADLIRYATPPPPPALDAADAQWAAEQVRRWQAAMNGTPPSTQG